MNIDKSLYMAEFLHMRSEVGCVELYYPKNTLHTNLYNEFNPKKEIKEVKEVIEGIQDKTIHLLKKEDQHIFFPDIEEEDIKLDIKVDDIKNIKISEGININKGDMKTITIDPNYETND
jgi:hypothetical protein